MRRRPVFDRWVEKIEFTDTCWLWTASLQDGYGRVWNENTMLLAHRYGYEILVAPIPESLTLDHLCRNRRCVNPDHLEPVSLKENILRGEGKGAKNAVKTHCPKGHEYTDANIRQGRMMKYGYRQCRICHNAWKAD